MKTPLNLVLAAALTSATAAQAAPANCLTREEMRGMTTYLLPSIIGVVSERCTASLGAGSALVTRTAVLRSELESHRGAAFPLARSAFAKFGGPAGAAAGKFMESLSEAQFRQLIEGTFTEKLVRDVKPEMCGDIERVLAPLAPLSGTDMANLIAEVMIIAARNDKRIPSCPAA